MGSENLADPPLEPVAPHGDAVLPAHLDAEPSGPAREFSAIVGPHHQPPPGAPQPLPPDADEIQGVREPLVPPECKTTRVRFGQRGVSILEEKRSNLSEE